MGVDHARWQEHARRASSLLILGAMTVVAIGCSSDDDDPLVPDVTAAEAFTAIVRWEVAAQGPVLDGSGDPKLPVIYLSAESGVTVDIGVQADVVEATVDEAVVRFSDVSLDSIDTTMEGDPVRDDGVMFVVGALPAGQGAVDASVRRYKSVDDDSTLRLQIVASDEGAIVTEVVEQDDGLN